MVRRVAVKVLLTDTEARTLDAIVRKAAPARDREGNPLTLTRASVMVGALAREFSHQFPEYAKRQEAIRRALIDEIDPDDPPMTMNEWLDRAHQIYLAEKMKFLDELEAAENDPGATD